MAYEMIYGRQPWPCRDCNSYLLNMKCQPLKFPFEKPVSEQYKDFIRKCLTIDEEKRVGWKEVFQHPVLIINQQERKYVADYQICVRTKRPLTKSQRRFWQTFRKSCKREDWMFISSSSSSTWTREVRSTERSSTSSWSSWIRGSHPRKQGTCSSCWTIMVTERSHSRSSKISFVTTTSRT